MLFILLMDNNLRNNWTSAIELMLPVMMMVIINAWLLVAYWYINRVTVVNWYTTDWPRATGLTLARNDQNTHWHHPSTSASVY